MPAPRATSSKSQLDLDGYPVTVIDTAGVRETDDPVEQEGVRRARARAAEADLVLWLIDAQGTHEPPMAAVPVWLVRNKIDLDALDRLGTQRRNSRQSGRPILKFRRGRGDGITALIAALVGFAQECFSGRARAV